MGQKETEQNDRPIDVCMDRWHQHLRGNLDGGLDGVLHPDVVFLSPIVFTPQNGREITKLYLMAAGGTLGGEDAPADEVGSSGDPSEADNSTGSDVVKPTGGAFRYIKEVRDGNHAMLEFETSIEGKYVNGIDIITCDEDGMITEFKVMIRPLQAVNLVHEQMKAMLEKLNG